MNRMLLSAFAPVSVLPLRWAVVQVAAAAPFAAGVTLWLPVD